MCTETSVIYKQARRYSRISNTIMREGKRHHVGLQCIFDTRNQLSTTHTTYYSPQTSSPPAQSQIIREVLTPPYPPQLTSRPAGTPSGHSEVAPPRPPADPQQQTPKANPHAAHQHPEPQHQHPTPSSRAQTPQPPRGHPRSHIPRRTARPWQPGICPAGPPQHQAQPLAPARRPSSPRRPVDARLLRRRGDHADRGCGRRRSLLVRVCP
jgi:hypothetical protein